jgi:hypothetical protein
MPSTVAIGTDGNVTLPSGHAAKLMSWAADFSQAAIETTNYADSGWRTFRGGLKGASGAAVGFPFFDVASSTPGFQVIASGGGSLTLTAATGCTYTGTAIITNIRHDTDLQGNARITFEFQFTGAITETWDVT